MYKNMKLNQAQLKRKLRKLGQQAKPDKRFLSVSRKHIMQEVQNGQPSTSLPVYKYKFVFAIAIAFILLIGVKFTTPVINSAKPGESLYLLDKTYENIQVVFIKDSNLRRQFFIDRTIERLEEMDELEKTKLTDGQSTQELKQVLIQDIKNTISNPEAQIPKNAVETFNQYIQEGFNAQQRVHFRSMLEGLPALPKNINQENNSEIIVQGEIIQHPIESHISPTAIPASDSTSSVSAISESISSGPLTEKTPSPDEKPLDILDLVNGSPDSVEVTPEPTGTPTPPEGDPPTSEIF